MKRWIAILAAMLLTGCTSVSVMKKSLVVPVAESNEEAAKETYLRIDYLDVGQADAALIECDGEYMMIDGGNRADSDYIYTVLKNRNVSELKYIVGTHAHEDHVGGLPATYHATTVKEALLPEENSDNEYYNELIYGLTEQSIKKTVVHPGEIYELGGAMFTILAPYTLDVEDVNNTSIVIKLDHMGKSFLFTGDAEWDEEQDILEKNTDLKCDVLKVGHHGSASSTSYRFLREAMPSIAVISVGKDNKYGHPTEEVLSRLSDAGVEVHRTDTEGTVTIMSDGNNITVNTERKYTEIENSGPLKSEENTTYILNTRSKKIHDTYCEAVEKMSEKNKEDYNGDLSELLKQGYEPCGICIHGWKK